MKKRYRWGGPLAITAVYFLFGTIWIFSSDYFVAIISSSPEGYARLQTYKGTIYVILTTALIFLLLNRYAEKVSEVMKSLSQKQTELSSVIFEKERLIRELHHRVRNNLQIVSALLRLSDESGPIDTHIRRIETLSVIQDELYRYTEGETVDLSAILHEVVRLCAVEGTRRHITFHEQFTPIHVLPDRGMYAGMILSELLTNAVLHAYPHGNSGSVAITTTRINGSIELTVRDYGVGIEHSGFGTGLSIADALSTQLGGRISILSEQKGNTGSRIEVLLPLDSNP